MNKKILSIFVFALMIFLPTCTSLSLDNMEITTSTTSTEYRALLIGIEEYEDPDSNLFTPREDVESMRDVLSKGSNTYSITELLDEDATKNNILEEIEDLREISNKNDINIIYYSGHGNNQINTKNPSREGDMHDEYLIPYDYYVDRYRKKHNFIRDDDFADRVLEIEGKLIIILDCCSGAGFAEDIEYNADSDTEIAVFSVHGEGQVSKELSTLGNGLLTFHLLSGFTTTNKDTTDGDDYITVREIYDSSKDIYDNAKYALDITYNGGINLDCISIDGSINDIALIKNFNNQRPEFTNKGVDCVKNKKGKVKFEAYFEDCDNNEIDIFVSWDRYGNGGWYDINSGGALEHEYDEKDKYRISFILKDSHGSISNWITKSVEVENSIILNNIFSKSIFLRFDLIKNIFKSLV